MQGWSNHALYQTSQFSSDITTSFVQIRRADYLTRHNEDYWPVWTMAPDRIP